MIIGMSSEAKARVTITLSRDVLRLVDRAAEKEDGSSRSAVIERYLRRAIRGAAEGEIARDTIAYYRSLSEEERSEEEALSEALGDAARRLQYDRPSRRRKR
jgi:metal-responsive CopG/Arc/MetJ family transcriptional regulator